MRNLRSTARVPQLLMFSLTMPTAMLVLFSQVFPSVADAPGFDVRVERVRAVRRDAGLDASARDSTRSAMPATPYERPSSGRPPSGM
jgi:hypothetical protein